MICVSEDTLAALVSGRSSDTERRAILAHCDECVHCHGLLRDILRLQTSRPEVQAVALDAAAGPDLLLRGMTVGKYEIMGLIGVGGMGVVYSARDPDLNRRVALKLVHPNQSSDADLAARLLRKEAQAMARLCHPNVVTVHEVGSFHGHVFVAMTLVDGQDIGQWIRERRPPTMDILQAFLHAGRGLAAAHRAGLLHRDVKPENILISRRGDVYISDFGLAHVASTQDRKMLDTDDEASVPLRAPVGRGVGAAVIGTPGYIAPEVMAGHPVCSFTQAWTFEGA